MLVKKTSWPIVSTRRRSRVNRGRTKKRIFRRSRANRGRIKKKILRRSRVIQVQATMRTTRSKHKWHDQGVYTDPRGVEALVCGRYSSWFGTGHLCRQNQGTISNKSRHRKYHSRSVYLRYRGLRTSRHLERALFKDHRMGKICWNHCCEQTY